MSRLLRFLRLPAADRILLIHTLLLVCAVRLGLWLVPFDRVRRRVDRLARPRESRKPFPPAEKIISAVEITSRYVPAASCLTQALAAQILLRQASYAATLRIGVLRTTEGLLNAHAWIECDGQPVLGQIPTLMQFVPLPPLESE